MTQTAEEASEAVGALVVGVLGGTGTLGRGLALRFAAAGQKVLLGSRDADRARSSAAEVGHGVRGAANEEVAVESDLVVAAVPYDGHRDLLAGIAPALEGKILVDCCNPIQRDERGAYVVPVEEGSAALQAAGAVPGARVVAAFHHISAKRLLDESVTDVGGDVLVLGDDREATDLVQALAGRIPGVRGVYAGRLRNAGQVEAFTANLISVNRRYKTRAALKVLGI